MRKAGDPARAEAGLLRDARGATRHTAGWGSDKNKNSRATARLPFDFHCFLAV